MQAKLEHASFEDASGPATQHIAQVCYGFHMHRGNPVVAATAMAFAAHRAKHTSESKHDETLRWRVQVTTVQKYIRLYTPISIYSFSSYLALIQALTLGIAALRISNANPTADECRVTPTLFVEIDDDDDDGDDADLDGADMPDSADVDMNGAGDDSSDRRSRHRRRRRRRRKRVLTLTEMERELAHAKAVRLLLKNGIDWHLFKPAASDDSDDTSSTADLQLVAALVAADSTAVIFALTYIFGFVKGHWKLDALKTLATAVAKDASLNGKLCRHYQVGLPTECPLSLSPCQIKRLDLRFMPWCRCCFLFFCRSTPARATAPSCAGVFSVNVWTPSPARAAPLSPATSTKCPAGPF